MDFIVVKRSRKKKNGRGKFPKVSNTITQGDTDLWSQDTLQRKLDNSREKLEYSEFLKSVQSQLSEFKDPIHKCIILGLGRIHTLTASLQLSLFFEIMKIFNLQPRFCSFYDPAFLKDDVEFLENKGFCVLPDPPTPSCLKYTLLYMPHCPTSLYETWLAAYVNDDPRHFIMCGNNLQLYVDNKPSKEIVSTYPNVYKMCTKNYYTRLLFPEFPNVYAFNDLSFHFHDAQSFVEKKQPSKFVDASSVAEHPS
ncbi:SRR1 family protein, DNA-repair associated protein, Srr1, conflicting annotations across species [Schizosaccharomyces pombe]|uniref:SRR1-like protein n=1 Tax=Schizosaccharomyces pombe (strain 972 / ATCC 24843) TaxID=284812 RepID=SRR1L_SCHPO|nr:SRR1 family protein [Schizosaccharomyces pombe]O60093.1 RecName: Full=SRR1-like protein [Schizosaccharomyces pombe 972h-]CAA18431.1 SRR1 family protein [Schizosaccharomyces pombe]|eukprot:NP_595916.1 SRR1 family protein [Schizosaccharomyces pombe]